VFNGPRGGGEDVLYLKGAVSVVKNEVVAVASAMTAESIATGGGVVSGGSTVQARVTTCETLSALSVALAEKT